MALPGFNGIIDVSHHNTIANPARIKAAGIVAVIHKATEGAGYRDKEYLDRRAKFKQAGLKWGSYHFASADNALDQVENYLTYTKPQADELICLDFEASRSGHSMSYAQMLDFVELVQQSQKRLPVIYGGSLLRETVNAVPHSILSECPLWYSRYAPEPFGVPRLWERWTLWQYTDGNIGPKPQTVPGIGNCDRDVFNGTADELLQKWPNL